MNIWTLVDPRFLTTKGSNEIVSFAEAYKQSEMLALGDLMVGTEPPLAIKLTADRAKPRSVTKDGTAHMTIGAVHLYCGGREITDKVEENLAFYFMMYGDWAYDSWTELDGDQVDALVFECKPAEPVPGQNFSLLGSLSSMFSSYYNSATLQDDRVKRLRAQFSPSRLGTLIPPDYEGKALPLWRIQVKPAGED
jgi:hypothetical protein